MTIELKMNSVKYQIYALYQNRIPHTQHICNTVILWSDVSDESIHIIQNNLQANKNEVRHISFLIQWQQNRNRLLKLSHLWPVLKSTPDTHHICNTAILWSDVNQEWNEITSCTEISLLDSSKAAWKANTITIIINMGAWDQ